MNTAPRKTNALRSFPARVSDGGKRFVDEGVSICRYDTRAPRTVQMFRRAIRTALVPPKAKELESTAASPGLSRAPDDT